MSSRRKTEFFINYTKLFPEPPDRDYTKLQIDRETVSYITTPYNSKLISQIITDNINSKYNPQNITIFDAMAGVGGDSIEFAAKYDRVISCEKDANRFSMLKNNISVYGFSNVDLHNSNCIDLLSENKLLSEVDVVYMDPPWGGKSYKNSDSLLLKIDDTPIEDLINSIISKKYKELMKMKLIVLKLPKNYDIEHLYYKTANSNTTLLMYELPKMLVLVFQLTDVS